MLKRIVAGSILIVILITALALGGWCFAIPFMICVSLSVHEMFRAIQNGGRRPVQWPVWLSMAAGIPVMVLQIGRNGAILSLIAAACMFTVIHIIFRREPDFEDVLYSLIPLFFVALPALCMLGLLQAEERPLQLMLLIASFGIPLMGDTFAYFIGVMYGHTKLCETISPKKTVEGAAAGLFGSMLFSVVLYLIFRNQTPSVLLWHAIALGLLAGVAGQAGDLFASMIKRKCGIKDFSNLIPGHGGMMDRLDSVFWSTVVVYIFFSVLLRGAGTL